MATVVSLTQTKIEELMAGWEGVSLSQDEINAIVSQLWTDVGSQGVLLEEFNTVTKPDLEADLAAGSIALNDFVTNTVPALEADISQNQDAINDLVTVDLPLLQDRVHTNELWIIDLNETILPQLYADLATNQGLIDEFNNVTLPDLNTRLEAVEGGSSFDPTELNNAIAALEGKFPIEAEDIAADAVTANAIAAHTITALEIAADTITANEIAADAITANEIASHTITANEIFADTITANEIATDTITANEIAADTITANEIAGHTITAAEIFADTITANEIATDTITANEIAADTITANEIAADTITANEIAADTITANEIAADAITTNELAAGAVTADNVFAGAITTDALAANAVTAAKVSSEILIANEIYSRAGYFGVVEATQINSGAIDAELGLLGLLQVGEITISPADGISVPGPNGLTLLSASGVGHRFAGAVDTDEVTINGGLTVNAENNTINGKIKLSNVVVPPTQQAGVTRYWPYTAPIGPDTTSLCDSHDGTKWVTVCITPTHRVRSYNKVTGAKIDDFAEDNFGADNVVYNITRAFNNYFMIVWRKSLGEWWLARCGNAFGSYTNLTRLADISNIGSVAIGRNEINGNVITAWKATDNATMTVREYDQAGTQQFNQSWTCIQPDGSNWIKDNGFGQGVMRGNIGPNGEEQLVANFGSGTRFFNVTTKALQWWPGYAEAPKGVTIEYGTTNKLRYIGYNTYRIYEWVREANWTTGANIDITYSWFDSKLAGSGKHETTPAPVLNYTGAWLWAALQIDCSAPSNTGGDDSPDSVVVYMDNNRQPEVPVGKVSNIFRQKVASGIPAKTTNEFVGAASYPGSIESAATFLDGISPRFRVRGDGQGNWGDLVVDGFGKATIGGDTGWIAVTSFTNLWENYGSTWPAVAYRKIGSRVFLRGLIRGPGNLGGSMFTLPVGFRPIVNIMLPAVVAQFTDSFAATGDNPAAFTTGSANSHTHSANPPQMDVNTSITITNVVSRVDVDTAGVVKHAGGSVFTAGSNWVNLTGLSFFVD